MHAASPCANSLLPLHGFERFCTSVKEHGGTAILAKVKCECKKGLFHF